MQRDRFKNGAQTIDDLIVLGRSSPDTMADGRVSVCVAGYSPSHGFVRLYPTRLDSPLRVWNVVSVPVERNDSDPRTESWKIQGSKREWDSLSDKIRSVGEVPRKERLGIVLPLVSGCIDDINDQRMSLGIVEPASRGCYLSEREDFDPAIQMTLMGGPSLSDKHRFPLQPRVSFRCSGCRASGGHDQQILEWGVYEWFRKYPGKEEQVWDNLFSKESTQRILFLVGSQARRLSSFMVVSILRIPIVKDP